MRVRFFGNPWPNEDRRAIICGSDDFKIPIEKVAGQRCIECSEPIKDNQRGVITACDMRIWGHFMLELPVVEEDFGGEPDQELIGKEQTIPVAAYHLRCWLEQVIGGEMSEKIMDRMRLHDHQKPLTNEEIDKMESSGLKMGDEDHDPGAGWFH